MKNAIKRTLLPALSLIFMLIFASNAKAATNEVSLQYQADFFMEYRNNTTHPVISYKRYSVEDGWSNYITDSMYLSDDKMKAISKLDFDFVKGTEHIENDLLIKTYISGLGWEKDFHDTSLEAGNASREINALALKLSDTYSANYDIYYRVYIKDMGWLSWAKNGEYAGTSGMSKPILNLQVKIIEKGAEPPEIIGDAYIIGDSKPVLSYSAHVSSYGWLDCVGEGEVAGTTDKALQMEAFVINIQSYNGASLNDMIEYKAHTADYGWLNSVKGGEIAGKVGEAKRMEAFQISLKGILAEKYSIYYRAHVQDRGWLGWTCDGGLAETTGYAAQLEEIEVKIVKKGDTSIVDENDCKPYYDYAYEKAHEPVLTYKAHVSNYGWLEASGDGETSGKTEKSEQLEAFTVEIKNAAGESFNDMIECKAHVSNYGWLSGVSGGKIVGTTGQSRKMEAFQIKLKGSFAEKYSIYYRAYVYGAGWLNWTCNGNIAGTVGYATQIQAIEISLVPKGGKTPTLNNDLPSYYEKSTALSVNYQAHIADYGWLGKVSEGKTGGKTGLAKRLEALKIELANANGEGSVKYKTHLSGIGWGDWNCDGAIAGTTGESRSVEAIEIMLTGKLAKKYDIYYRIHSQDYGWLGWACNGEKAGTTGLAKRAEAIEVRIVPKGLSAPGTTKMCYVCYQSFGIDVSSYNGKIDWSKIKESGKVDFAMVRVGYRGYTKGTLVTDKTCEYNIKNALANGIKVGLYYYSTATSEAEAIEEALKTIEIARKYKISYPIVYDYEYINVQYDAQGNQYRTWGTTKTQRSTYAIAFLRTIKNAGYKAMMYGCSYDLKSNWETDRILKTTGCELWEANYGSNKPTYDINTYTINNNMSGYECDMYQFSSSGIITDTMDSAYVDVNVSFKNY